MLTGCATNQAARQDALIAWTRYYEGQMGLEDNAVVFGHLPKDWCGAAFASRIYFGDFIGYDTAKKRCSLMSPKELALHETCHVRYAHTHRDGNDRAKHREVRVCADHYR